MDIRKYSANILFASLMSLASGMTQTANAIFEEQDGPFPREGECNINDPIFADVRHLLGPDNNIGPDTLKNTAIPEPQNISEFVRNKQAAIRLGKALFWDMQVGSDGIQACATCHFRAGADPRSKNQVSPGGQHSMSRPFETPPNSQLTREMFPLHKLEDPKDRTSRVIRSIDDVISSQGIFSSQLSDVQPGDVSDTGTVVPDERFNVGGVNTRRVEPRNTPTVINAVFNHRNFWDGRADSIFNGVNEFGVRDENAKVIKSEQGRLQAVKVRIDNASLASQAVAPPLSLFEMGFINRSFRDVGKRLASAKPLALQHVHAEDSVLGTLASRNGLGLNTTYERLIRAAFKPEWWSSSRVITVQSESDVQLGDADITSPLNLDFNQYTQLEYNFSLFFGLAIQLYEATLVSDDAKVDQHFDRINNGLPGILTAEEQKGLELFEAAGCADCHSGPEFSNASIRTTQLGFINPGMTPQFQHPEQIERMFIGSCEVAVYDQGFYNIGVTPWDADLGMGVNDPFGNPLSIAVLRTLDPESVPSQELLDLEYPNLGDIGRVPPISQGERTSITGAFKIPGLRNVALTAPYFHNGGKRTLREVVEFYNRGGDFHDYIGPGGVPQDQFMDLVIGRLELTDEEIDLIVTFLHTLTDQRVVEQKAPFDHPELLVPNGHTGDEFRVSINELGVAEDEIIRVPAVGRNGGPLPAGFLEDN